MKPTKSAHAIIRIELFSNGVAEGLKPKDIEGRGQYYVLDNTVMVKDHVSVMFSDGDVTVLIFDSPEQAKRLYKELLSTQHPLIEDREKYFTRIFSELSSLDALT